MKLVLNITFGVLFVAGVCATSQENSIDRSQLSHKERARYDLKRNLQRHSEINIGEICPLPLSPKQILFANEKYAELIECGNATIDIYLNKLDDDVNFDQIEEQIVKVSGPLCEIFDDIFRCIGQFNPVIDLCLEKREQIFKDKLFGIVPLIQQAMCLRNGALIAEILQLKNSERCLRSTQNAMVNVGLYELFESESDELFGDVRVCQGFNEILTEFYTKLGECSPDVLEKVKDMLGFFCEHTQCERFVDDMRCY